MRIAPAERLNTPDPSPVPPGPANSLSAALRRMSWEVEPGSFALVGFQAPPRTEDLGVLEGAGPCQFVSEGGETTLLVRAELLEPILARHPGAQVQRELCWIRFRAPMGWEVVGFLALVSRALADAGVPLGAVCGYSRDHLFVARRHLEQASAALAELFPRSASRSP